MTDAILSAVSVLAMTAVSLAILAWLTVLPSIGLMWLCGWLA